MGEYLTIKEVAELLKVKEITIRRWIVRGWLPALRFGRGFRVKKEDIEKHGKFDKSRRR